MNDFLVTDYVQRILKAFFNLQKNFQIRNGEFNVYQDSHST